MRKTKSRFRAVHSPGLLIALTSFLSLNASPSFADDHKCCVDWSKLNLTHSQGIQLKQLEDQWNGQYSSLKPSINDDERKLQEMLADHNSDSFEVMALQAAISRKKEQLQTMAMQNFLKKRQLLNEKQQQQLESMVRLKIAERNRLRNPGANTTVMPDHIQDLVQRVRSIWTDQSETK